MTTSKLTDYQTLLHRMVYRKLQWLDYYGDGDVQAATNACYAFADLVVKTQADSGDQYLIQLHDATISACQSGPTVADSYVETLGTLFNNSREIYIACFHADPIRALPSDHPRFPWEYRVDAPQDPEAIDVATLTEPLSPPPASDQVTSTSPWLVPMSISAAFSIALLFIVIGLGDF